MIAQELRIGNYININDGIGSDDFRQIKGVSEDRVSYLVKGCERVLVSTPVSEVYDIHLTEEILLKCGFTVKECFYYKKRVWIENGKDGAFILVGIGGVILKHLHQLQNLFFSITGQELEAIL